MNPRVLIVQPPGPGLGKSLPAAFQTHASELAVEFADAASNLAELVRERGFDAVVCWAERAEELDLVVRIRASSPDLPILTVTPDQDDELQAKAMESGATTVLLQGRALPAFVSLIEQAVNLRITARQTRAMARQNWNLSKEVRSLTQETKSISEETRRRLERPYRAVPIPLLVSNDAGQALQMLKAFEKAEMFAPLPTLRSSEEAIAYLSGGGAYANRERFPLPTLVILDFHGPGLSGLEVLGWIRQNDRLKHLPVIMLSGTLNAGDLKGAYGLQANSYLIKPGNFDELVEMVKAINLYWSSLNVAP
jgi:DNA-binding response OmpR family regulator